MHRKQQFQNVPYFYPVHYLLFLYHQILDFFIVKEMISIKVNFHKFYLIF